MNDAEKKKFINQKYEVEQLSWKEIADLVGVPKTVLYRTAKKLGIKSRSLSESQKIALESGRSTHPTEGKKISDEVKKRMSESISKTYQNMPKEKKEQINQKHKENFNNRSEKDKQLFWDKAYKKIREASEKGSKAEKYILGKLLENNYDPKFHVSQLIGREQMEIDILIPSLSIAIEVDGPFHYTDVFNNMKIEKIKEKDRVKNGLLLSKGFSVIRLIVSKIKSERHKNAIWSSLLDTIEKIKKSNEPSVYTLEID